MGPGAALIGNLMATAGISLAVVQIGCVKY